MANISLRGIPQRGLSSRRPRQEVPPLSELLPDGAGGVRALVAPPATLLSEVERGQGPARPDLSAYDGGPSLLNAPYEPPAGDPMPIGADTEAYGGGKDSGILKRLAPILELVGKLGMGAQAGAREPGFLSGMGGGYRNALPPAPPESDPASLLKAEADLIRAKADAEYKGVQGEKVTQETDLLRPQFGLDESEIESENFLREKQAEYQQAYAGYRRQFSRWHPELSQAKIDQASAAAALDEIETKLRRARLEFMPEESRAKILESQSRTAMNQSNVARGPGQDRTALIRAERPSSSNVVAAMLGASTIDSRLMKAESDLLKQAIDRHGGEQALSFMTGEGELQPVLDSIRQEVEERMAPLRRQAEEQKRRLYGESQIPGLGGGGQGAGLDPLDLGFR